MEAVVCVVCSENSLKTVTQYLSGLCDTWALFSIAPIIFIESSSHPLPPTHHRWDTMLCRTYSSISLHSNLHPSCHTLPLWQLQLEFLLNSSSPHCNNAQKHTNEDTFLSLGNLNPPDTQTLRSLPKSTYMGASVGSSLFQLTTLQTPSLRTVR